MSTLWADLNDEQLAAFHEIVSAVLEHVPRHVVLAREKVLSRGDVGFLCNRQSRDCPGLLGWPAMNRILRDFHREQEDSISGSKENCPLSWSVSFPDAGNQLFHDNLFGEHNGPEYFGGFPVYRIVPSDTERRHKHGPGWKRRRRKAPPEIARDQYLSDLFSPDEEIEELFPDGFDESARRELHHLSKIARLGQRPVIPCIVICSRCKTWNLVCSPDDFGGIEPSDFAALKFPMP